MTWDGPAIPLAVAERLFDLSKPREVDSRKEPKYRAEYFGEVIKGEGLTETSEKPLASARGGIGGRLCCQSCHNLYVSRVQASCLVDKIEK